MRLGATGTIYVLCVCFLALLCFFFSSRRRHTRWTGDWSSDVCSSDLVTPLAVVIAAGGGPTVVGGGGGGSALVRSEERRVGKEGRFRGAPDHLKKKK